MSGAELVAAYVVVAALVCVGWTAREGWLWYCCHDVGLGARVEEVVKAVVVAAFWPLLILTLLHWLSQRAGCWWRGDD